MAHETQVTGKVSEMTVARALMANGWQVSQPLVPEVYDLVAKEPMNGEFKTIQVKTLVIRPERDNAYVIKAKKGNGEPYLPSECDYVVGVDGDTVYMTECTGLGEYWSNETNYANRWIKFTTDEFTLPGAAVI